MAILGAVQRKANDTGVELLGRMGLPVLPLRAALLMRCAASALVGTALGYVCTVIVNSTLIEVSLSGFFSTYFGILFIAIGAVVRWRLQPGGGEAAQVHGQTLFGQESPERGVSTLGGNTGGTFGAPAVGATPEGRAFGVEEVTPEKNRALHAFSYLILASGVLCLFLQDEWLVSLPVVAKVPLYAVLGVSVSFALVFSVVDAVNWLFGLFQPAEARSIVDSRAQALLVLLVCSVMGAAFGLIFGVNDVEDIAAFQVQMAIRKQENACLPIGLTLGAGAGFLNEYLRQAEKTKRRLFNAFDHEI